jgi:hypothetical protein
MCHLCSRLHALLHGLYLYAGLVWPIMCKISSSPLSAPALTPSLPLQQGTSHVPPHASMPSPVLTLTSPLLQHSPAVATHAMSACEQGRSDRRMPSAASAARLHVCSLNVQGLTYAKLQALLSWAWEERYDVVMLQECWHGAQAASPMAWFEQQQGCAPIWGGRSYATPGSAHSADCMNVLRLLLF